MTLSNPLVNTDQYPNLKQILAPEYAVLPPAEIEALMEGMFGPGAAEYYEDYLEGIFGDIGNAFKSAARDVGRFAAKAAPAIATVGGGAIQGALAGAPLGLPGIIAGAAAGGTGAAFSKYGKGSLRQIGSGLTSVTNLAGQFSPAGRVGGAVGPAISGLASGGGRNVAGQALNIVGSLLGKGGGGANAVLGNLTSLFGGSGASGQLLSLLQRPETLQALAALNLGSIGRRTIPVGSAQTPVPTSAIARVVGELVEQSIAEAAAIADGSEGDLSYMTDAEGEFIGDPALASDRAARVWELLNAAQAERLVNSVALQEQLAEAYDEAYDEDYGEDLSEEDYSEDFSEYLAEAFGEDYGDLSEDEY